MYTFNREEYNKRMEWYLDARFGMFIHWGLYSIPARGEWVRSEEEIPKEDYMKILRNLILLITIRAWARAAKRSRYEICGTLQQSIMTDSAFMTASTQISNPQTQNADET